jgi:hypothetical protein
MASPAMQFSSTLPLVHGMGQDLAPPRSRYLVQIPAILMLTGLVTWVAADEAAMAISAAISAAVAIYLLWDWLFRAGPTRLSTVYAFSLLAGYGGGALNTWLTLPRGGATLASVLGADEDVLARGMAAVMMTCAVLCFIGELYERPVFGRDFRVPLNRQTFTLIYFATGAFIVGFLTHSLGYGGVASAVGGQQNPAAALLSWAFGPFIAISAAVFLAAPKGIAKLLTGVCLLILSVLLMTVSRTMIVYTAMEVIFALRLTGYRVKGTVVKKFLLLGVLAVFVFTGVTVLMLFRLAGFQSRDKTNISLAERVTTAASWVEDGTALTRANEANQGNVQKRTFVLGFFADILEGSSQKSPAYGLDSAYQLAAAVPRVFFPNKDAVGMGEESLDDELFGLTYKDAANTLLTAGATDFGLIGVLLYPLVTMWIFSFSFRILSGYLSALPMSIILLGIIFVLLQTESTLTHYAVAVRNEILFAVLLLIFYKLPAFRLRH